MSAAATPSSTATERREPVVEAVERFLRAGRHDAVVAVVRQLLTRNEELERHRGGTEKNEAVGRAQLLLLVNKADETRPVAEPAVLAEADQLLRKASGIDEDPPKKAKAPRSKHGRKGFPKNLRRVSNPIPVAPEQVPCPRCGKDRKVCGHETSERLEVLPAELVVYQDIREKRACDPCEAEMVRAPVVEKVVAGGLIGASVGAQIVVDKYDQGLPLYRQQERFARMGWPVARSVLCDQVAHVAELLEPLHRAARELVLQAEVMHTDGTRLRVRDPKHPKVIYNGSLWGYLGRSGPLAVAFFLFASTGKKVGQKEGEIGPEEFLSRRRGKVVADASNVFDASFKQGDRIECGCNMHGRRPFWKAADAGDPRAALPLAAYKRLYQIEAEVRGREPAEVLQERQRRSRPVFDALVAWAKVHQPYEPPQSLLGKAIGYLVNHAQALGRFLEDGTIPIDNGEMEHQFIRVSLARMNFRFAGSEEGARWAAIIFTVLACCRLADVNPLEYLNDVLPRLARGGRELDFRKLLPHLWKAARQKSPVAPPAPNSTK
jgi:transposase